MLKPWKSIKILADNKIVFITHQIYFQERTEDLPGESKKYTRLMSHSTASIASILKIPRVDRYVHFSGAIFVHEIH